ncbi:hypothetical protein [Streptomyces sp. DH37]|uniref:hypothetical protein n=1 Tax=Streptomyces sp. DH37 TaxID=3040122 RepID=UPI002440FF22|nr:hypothetical protein [Streptomyces sp. DH37]MDG9703742.1 hypothetical protein [Streptomyces sp. DH37]
MTDELWARLMAESIPDGTFGGPRPDAPRAPRPVSPQQAAHNRAELEAALDETDAKTARSTRRRHLRAVPATDQPDLGAA